jgi:hypothetical protein
MNVPSSQSPVASPHGPLDPMLIGAFLEEESAPAARLEPVQVEPKVAPALAKPAIVETRPGPDFSDILRANLQAAAQHAALGHEGASFRECSRPSCRNASNLIPHPVAAEPESRDELALAV